MFVRPSAAFSNFQTTGPFSLVMSPAMKLSTEQLYQTQVFTDFTANLIPEQVAELKAKLEQLSKADDFITSLQQALDCFDTKDPILSNSDYPYYAFLGMCQDRISVEDFTFLMRFWNVQSSDILVMPVFSEGNLLEEPAALLRSTFLFINRTPDGKVKEKTPLLTTEQTEEFFRKITTLPKFQQQFFLIPDKKSASQFIRVTQAIFRNGFNVFGSVRHQGKSYRMIASTEMLKAFLEVKFGTNAAKAHFNFGLSTVPNLEAKLPRGRDFAIPFPLFPTPNLADQHHVIEDDFPWHDWYHLYILSCIPMDERIRLLTFPMIIKRLAANHPNMVWFSERFRASIVDMEHTYYVNHAPNELPILLWEMLNRQIYGSITADVVSSAKSDLSLKSFQTLSKQKWAEFLQSMFAKALANHLIRNAVHYRNSYGINLLDLFQAKEVDDLKQLILERLMQVLPNDASSLQVIKDYSEDPVRVYGATLKLTKLTASQVSA